MKDFENMKIIKNRNAKNILACMLAVELYAMQFFMPPYKVEEYFVHYVEEEKEEFSRKRTKKYNTSSTGRNKYTFEG